MYDSPRASPKPHASVAISDGNWPPRSQVAPPPNCLESGVPAGKRAIPTHLRPSRSRQAPVLKPCGMTYTLFECCVRHMACQDALMGALCRLLMNDGGEFEMRRLTNEAPDYLLVLHRALGLNTPLEPGRPHQQVAALLANVQRGTASLDLLYAAYRGSQLLSCCVAIESPGRAALVCVSHDATHGRERLATAATLRAVRDEARRRSIVLLQVLSVPGEDHLHSALEEAGFRYLTRLRYLSRGSGERKRPTWVVEDLEWIDYAAQIESLFQDAVGRSYAQSMDCPELTGLRPIPDVLASHRATGIFEPGFWWVAKRDQEPVGVILLNSMSGRPALEVVYMGVAQPARGTGVGDALLGRAVEAVRRSGASILALAVDERNLPARRMYARWGFVETGARDAWIASSGAA